MSWNWSSVSAWAWLKLVVWWNGLAQAQLIQYLSEAWGGYMSLFLAEVGRKTRERRWCHCLMEDILELKYQDWCLAITRSLPLSLLPSPHAILVDGLLFRKEKAKMKKISASSCCCLLLMEIRGSGIMGLRARSFSKFKVKP